MSPHTCRLTVRWVLIAVIVLIFIAFAARADQYDHGWRGYHVDQHTITVAGTTTTAATALAEA